MSVCPDFPNSLLLLREMKAPWRGCSWTADPLGPPETVAGTSNILAKLNLRGLRDRLNFPI
jgi:hypothetical protein